MTIENVVATLEDAARAFEKLVREESIQGVVDSIDELGSDELREIVLLGVLTERRARLASTPVLRPEPA